MAEESTAQNNKLNVKGAIRLRTMRLILIGINLLCVIPILFVAFFNVPSADDFSMSFEVHEAFLKTGNPAYTFFYAIYMGLWYYTNWTGYFFSDALTAFAPSVFGEKLYFLGTFGVMGVLTLGLWYFLRQLLSNALRINSDLAGCITGIVYFMMVQCMPGKAARVENFFWYSGAINYMFMFGLGLLWLGVMIRTVCAEKSGQSISVLLCILGFLLGGANYMTALSLGILSFCILFISCINCILEKKNEDKEGPLTDIFVRLSGLKKAWVPALFNIVGLITSMCAPGNSNRELTGGYSPVKAVLISIYYTMEHMLGTWLTWPVILSLMILVPFLWKAAGRVKRRYKFGHPVLFTSFAFLLSAANITPPLYATGNIEAGRICGIFYAQSMLLLVLAIGYICGWIRCVIAPARIKDGEKEERRKPSDIIFDGYLGVNASKVVMILFVCLVIGSAFAVKVNPHFYTTSSAIGDMINGSAFIYNKEFMRRLDVLKNAQEEEVSLPEFSKKPELLFFSDITEDKNDWLNKAFAEYYHKKSVVLIRN